MVAETEEQRIARVQREIAESAVRRSEKMAAAEAASAGRPAPIVENNTGGTGFKNTRTDGAADFRNAAGERAGQGMVTNDGTFIPQSVIQAMFAGTDNPVNTQALTDFYASIGLDPATAINPFTNLPANVDPVEFQKFSQEQTVGIQGSETAEQAAAVAAGGSPVAFQAAGLADAPAGPLKDVVTDVVMKQAMTAIQSTTTAASLNFLIAHQNFRDLMGGGALSPKQQTQILTAIAKQIADLGLTPADIDFDAANFLLGDDVPDEPGPSPAPAQPGQPAPGVGDPSGSGRGRLVQDFLDSDPNLALNAQLNRFRDSGVNHVFLAFFRGQFQNLWSEFLGYLGQVAINGRVPDNVNFTDWLLEKDVIREFFANPATMRGSQAAATDRFASGAAQSGSIRG